MFTEFCVLAWPSNIVELLPVQGKIYPDDVSFCQPVESYLPVILSLPLQAYA